MPRTTRVSVAPQESPKMSPPTPPGWCPLALPAQKNFSGKKRPEGWRGGVYGLVVHTTGRGLPEKAAKAGQYPTVRAVNYYAQERGCHYVNGYRGHEGGDLLQMAHEDEQANGVGTGDQRDSIRAGRWEKDLPASLVKRWKERWEGYSNPLDLLPGTKTANGCYLHVECIPLTKHWGDFNPAWHHSLFTEEQHLTVAALVCDIAKRNKWPKEWWRTPRLLGHEDLTPLTRHTSKGGWDPGWLTASPAFDWDIVIEEILRIKKVKWRAAQFKKFKKTREGGLYTKY